MSHATFPVDELNRTVPAVLGFDVIPLGIVSFSVAGHFRMKFDADPTTKRLYKS